MGIVPFIAPIIAFASTNPAMRDRLQQLSGLPPSDVADVKVPPSLSLPVHATDPDSARLFPSSISQLQHIVGVQKNEPWSNRYTAWTLFRVLAYISSAAHATTTVRVYLSPVASLLVGCACAERSCLCAAQNQHETPEQLSLQQFQHSLFDFTFGQMNALVTMAGHEAAHQNVKAGAAGAEDDGLDRRRGRTGPNVVAVRVVSSGKSGDAIEIKRRSTQTGAGGLEVIHTGGDVPSVVADVGVSTGKWYYEVVLLSDSGVSVGWALDK
jgi:hypothetical protein